MSSVTVDASPPALPAAPDSVTEVDFVGLSFRGVGGARAGGTQSAAVDTDVVNSSWAVNAAFDGPTAWLAASSAASAPMATADLTPGAPPPPRSPPPRATGAPGPRGRRAAPGSR